MGTGGAGYSVALVEGQGHHQPRRQEGPQAIERGVDRSADGPVVVYMFPVTNEITKSDRRPEFDADVGRLELTQSFCTEDIVWQGKLAL